MLKRHRSYIAFAITIVLTACATDERASSVVRAPASSPSDPVVALQGRPIAEGGVVQLQSPTPARQVTVEPQERALNSPKDVENPNWPPRHTPEPADIANIAVSKLTPAARTPAFAPPKWDPTSYRRDPQVYLDDTMPGRVHQTAQPAADMQFLTVDGPAGFEVAPLARITLAVRGEPWMPVTFTSFGLGAFVRTGQISVTVPADGEGRATAAWVATSGTVGSVHILAGSPARAGQVQFLIRVTE